MKLADFRIGLDFFSAAGVPHRCTDVGQRTILAIALDRFSGKWYQGPPYPVEELPFDELALRDCYLTEEQAAAQAIEESQNGFRPTYSATAIQRFLEARATPDYLAYPNKPLLRLTKAIDNDIVQPYGVRKSGDFWFVLCYMPFDDEYIEMQQSSFLSLDDATEDNFRRRAMTALDR